MTIEAAEGKKILIIHNGGSKLDKLFQNTCQKLGMTYEGIPDKPNEKAFGKIAGRLHLAFYEKILNKYYRKTIESLNNGFDYILVIRGEYTPTDSISLLQEKNPNAKMILYMWDSIRNNKGIQNKWPLFDSVYTFDRHDFIDNKGRIGFVPLYYCEEYIEQVDKSLNPEYDIAFIGTAHGDRVKIVKEVERFCTDNDLNMFRFLYCPHILVYIYNKLFNKDYRHVKLSDLSFNPMTQKEIYEIYSKAESVLDVEIKTQTGLTMRTIDILGLKKKLITTNKDIINYDFYDENNILVIDRDSLNIDTGFLKKPYKEIKKEIYDKYSMKNWLLRLIG